MALSTSSYSRWQQISAFVVVFFVTFLAATIGSIGSMNAPQFYRELVLPDWAPPSWLFGPVWTLLYVMMAISAWLVWRSNRFVQTGRALQMYGVQLVLNALWSWLFFAWYQGAAAFAEIVLLWLSIVITMVLFYRHSQLAAVLMLPYVLWVSFASVLNWSIWQLNQQML